MKRKQKLSPLWIAMMILALALTACSPSAAEKYLRDGNEAFGKDAYEEALGAYQAAQIKEPELAEPYYNAANALYRQGEYGAALEQLNMALSFAESDSLTQDSFFNLGNSSYNAQDLGTAIAAYTETLLRNPDDQDAKYNLELALQQQEQQQQEQEQQEQEQEQQQEQEQEQDSQSQEDQGEQGEQEQDQEGGEGQDEQDQEQPQDGEQGEEEQDSEGSQGDQQSEDQQDEQQQDGQQGEEPQDPSQNEGGQANEPGQEEQGQPNYVPAPGQKMTEEQAEQLLAAIAKDGDTLQERLGQILVVPRQPPLQDW